MGEEGDQQVEIFKIKRVSIGGGACQAARSPNGFGADRGRVPSDVSTQLRAQNANISYRAPLRRDAALAFRQPLRPVRVLGVSGENSHTMIVYQRLVGRWSGLWRVSSGPLPGRDWGTMQRAP